jgi:hypothetical protein
MERFREVSRRTQAGIAAVVMTLATAAPVVFAGSAGATPTLSNRTLTTSTARPSQPTQLKWTFNTTTDVANIKQISIEFCDSPLATCSAGSGTSNIPTIAASPTATLTNFTSNTVTSTTRVNGLGTGSNNQIDIVKTNADAGASLSGASVQLGATDITNNAQANKSYYTRVRLYSDTGTTLVWSGVFAQSTSQTLTVNARVQERLDFCVASTAINNDTATPGADCAAVTTAGTSSIDIGNIDSSATNVSPVSATNGGSNTNAVAMIRTNAFNGASVAYRALGDNNSGTLKVTGAACDDNNGGTAGPDIFSAVATDQCFNTSPSQGAFTVGTTGEKFGMTVAGINGGSTSAYSCATGGVGCDMVRDPAYDGNGTGTFVADSDQVTGTTSAGYAWDADPSHTTTIATSTGSTIKVVDDEAMILKFAALSGITTPTGAYTVQADFIATTTF